MQSPSRPTNSITVRALPSGSNPTSTNLVSGTRSEAAYRHSASLTRALTHLLQFPAVLDVSEFARRGLRALSDRWRSEATAVWPAVVPGDHTGGGEFEIDGLRPGLNEEAMAGRRL
jgi:hypothetical protein